ncbi:MAG: type II CRISPR-associated endonuclease Cas1 [Gammaproteobacteria bacterium]|nr:type II CRISPR-associated endonuclease Cas1 [Gammaproteobacteria bacterium]
MKHLVVVDYGTFLGLDSHRLAVRDKDNVRHYPLNRLCTISIAKRGVSFSSDLVESLSARGIKLFFLDFRGVQHSALLGQSQHGVVAVRTAQMAFCQKNTLSLAKKIVAAKIKNQRAVLNHLGKYHRHPSLQSAAGELLQNAAESQKARNIEALLGFEGASANAYFQSLREAQLFSSSFRKREGRGSREINNAMLNLGYAVLSSYILNAVINAGLEPYLGIMHTTRPGRMALVLDIMEEYRAWVVDRSVIKLRAQSEGKEALNLNLKKALIREIQKTCAKKYNYRGKKHKLEHIIQRQMYRLCGHFYEEKTYKPYLFKW